MYLSNIHGPSDAERRANNRGRYGTLLASVSMLTLGLSLGTAGLTGSVPAASAAAANTAIHQGANPAAAAGKAIAARSGTDGEEGPPEAPTT